MKVVIQRVSSASVTIKGQIVSAIDQGLLVLLGVSNEDTKEDEDWLVNKVLNLRIFDDERGVMNKSVLDVEGQILVVSQFTLHASTKKGNRPSYMAAARPEVAIPAYESFVHKLQKVSGKPVFTGEFGANMKVALVNEGPVTIIIDTNDKK